MKKLSLAILVIGGLITILFPPYSFSDIEGYGFIFGKVTRVGFWLSQTVPVIQVIDFKMLVIQLLIITGASFVAYAVGKQIEAQGQNSVDNKLDSPPE